VRISLLVQGENECELAMRTGGTRVYSREGFRELVETAPWYLFQETALAKRARPREGYRRAGAHANFE